MFVHDRAFVLRKFQRIAGIAHGQRERAGFLGVESAKENGHEHRRHLVIGNFACGESGDEFLNPFGRDRLATAFGFDE
jgi:hypothetical protein